MYLNQNMVTKKNIINVIFSSITLCLSLYITPYYVDGDQFYYSTFYSNIVDFDIFNGYIYYNSTLGAQEPFYYLLIYFCSKLGIAKEILMTIVNVLFSYLLINLLQKLRVNIFVAFSFLLNYYFLVLLFSAERLKVALTVLLFSFVVASRFWKFFLSVFSFLFHFQLVFLLVSVVLDNIKSFFIKIKNFIVRWLLVLMLIIFVVVLFMLFRNHLLLKYLAYSGQENFLNIIKPGVFLILTLLIGKGARLKIFMQFLPLIIASVMLGEDRIVIFCYFVFLVYALNIKNGFNFLVLITSFYFVIGGYSFIQNILQYGTGFYEK